jgi:signal transduction histidine kinase
MKDDFVAAVSHELRTPLTSIMGYVKTMLRPGVNFGPRDQRDFLQAIDRQAERLRNLIEDLLIVSRIEALETKAVLSAVRLPDLAQRVIEDFGPAATQRSFELDFGRGLPEVVTDEGKLHQVISNLVDNALKYSPVGTTVVMRGRAEGNGVVVSVEDRGTGIPRELQQKIFERFYQVDQSSTRPAGGTGLGLYICQRLAEAIGGRLWLARSDESGSEFCVWIPRSLEETQGSKGSNLPPGLVALKGGIGSSN